LTAGIMGVLNRMIKKKGSNTKGKSAATCKNEKKKQVKALLTVLNVCFV
jgi:hypothetical protein